jgi:uncharacterized YigZ family protein
VRELIKAYKTVLNCAEEIYIEKKSKFIASIKPVETEDEAVFFVNELKAKYSDATHNVYAYRICGENFFQRFSDDGEPSGTAGIPVLEAMKKQDLQNVVIVVTRYFGGTMLGTAGLIRAYGKTAQLGIDKATIVRKVLCKEAIISIEYPLIGRVQNTLILKGFSIKKIIYSQKIEIIVYVPKGDEESFAGMIDEATNGVAIMDFKGQCYVDI